MRRHRSWQVTLANKGAKNRRSGPYGQTGPCGGLWEQFDKGHYRTRDEKSGGVSKSSPRLRVSGARVLSLSCLPTFTLSACRNPKSWSED